MSYVESGAVFSNDIKELSRGEIDLVGGADRGDATAGGAVAGAFAGATAGGRAGAALGAWGGPAGFVAGMVAGALVGGLIGYAAYEIGNAPSAGGGGSRLYYAQYYKKH